ncbi:MAG: thiamine ABC transporter substrate-binding protein [Spirochaetaceae bacterium]|jgi:thiamine transport system substrate-binding protein|nr:thiamine ABC transporter substrate-binding protein [Spirochaetaceae bacterium]
MYGKNHASIDLFLVLGFTFFLLFPSLVFGGGNRQKPSAGEAAAGEVVIWTYDSFNSEWGPGPEISKRFEAETGITVKWVVHGDAGEVLSRLLLEGKNAGADIVLGLDQNMADRALGSGLFEAYKPRGAEALLPELIIDGSYRLIPWDYSYFAIVYDSRRIPNPPRNLEDLTQGIYAKKLILMDPRTSSPGLGFLNWTSEVYGDGWKDYWRRLGPSILTIADGWSSGYGLFTAGEAPLVLSYTTSPGYHLEYEDSEQYRAALFTDGHPIQIELAGLLAAGKNKENAKQFLDFMLSPAFQEVIPLTNWMYPVIDIPLPASFRINPKSDKPLRPRPVSDRELDEWTALSSSLGG